MVTVMIASWIRVSMRLSDPRIFYYAYTIIPIVGMSSDRMIDTVKQKSNQISRTEFGQHTFSKLWYTDDINKICLTFSPRGGCSVSFKQYLDLVGLLADGEAYQPFIHKYRMEIFLPHVQYFPIEQLINQQYTFIKFVMNPYIRAVSIYWHGTSYDKSFREYLHMRLEPALDHRTSDEKWHSMEQYITGEEKIITKYIKISDNETYSIMLKNGEEYEFNPNKFTSIHHGTKHDTTEFCGDIPRSIICKMLPDNYKWFYDEEIRGLVERLYSNDIEQYGFKFFDE